MLKNEYVVHIECHKTKVSLEYVLSNSWKYTPGCCICILKFGIIFGKI
jgi:hypothetical protein